MSGEEPQEDKIEPLSVRALRLIRRCEKLENFNGRNITELVRDSSVDDVVKERAFWYLCSQIEPLGYSESEMGGDFGVVYGYLTFEEPNKH